MLKFYFLKKKRMLIIIILKLEVRSSKFQRRRVSYNGNTIGFQPVDGGPIPPTRSNINTDRLRSVFIFWEWCRGYFLFCAGPQSRTGHACLFRAALYR